MTFVYDCRSSVHTSNNFSRPSICSWIGILKLSLNSCSYALTAIIPSTGAANAQITPLSVESQQLNKGKTITKTTSKKQWYYHTNIYMVNYKLSEVSHGQNVQKWLHVGFYVQQETTFLVFDSIVFMSNSQTNSHNKYGYSCKIMKSKAICNGNINKWFFNDNSQQ